MRNRPAPGGAFQVRTLRSHQVTAPSRSRALRKIRLELAPNNRGPAILLGWRNEPDYASSMDLLLLIGDGSKYIDVSKAQKFDGRG
jgi:hypothetical protein